MYCDHMEIGVRELKKHLSAWLDRAARGEVIQVTDRGQPKAVLGPVPGRVRLDAGIAEGWIRPGSGEAPRTVRRHRGTRPTADALGEDRGA